MPFIKHRQFVLHANTNQCTHTCTHTFSMRLFPWPVAESLPLPAEVGSLSRWSLWPHNNDSWLPGVTSPTTGVANSYRITRTVTATAAPLTVAARDRGRRRRGRRREVLQPPSWALQKYQKGKEGMTHQLIWDPHGPFPLCVLVRVCVFGQGKAWQRQKYRWQLGGLEV